MGSVFNRMFLWPKRDAQAVYIQDIISSNVSLQVKMVMRFLHYFQSAVFQANIKTVTGFYICPLRDLQVSSAEGADAKFLSSNRDSCS